MPVENAVIDRPTTKSNFTSPDLPGLGKKELPSDILSIDNERANTNISILDPLPSKDSNGRPISSDELKPLFSYLSRTRQLETDTAKTGYLQEIAEKMTKGTNIKSRVVVMQKGEGEEAFCTEDGTIFLSQSLINCLDSVGEIAAVIAHETSHLLNHTVQMKRQTWNKLGVAWTHELVADTQAPSLLEKTGFNSLAFASAIEKISGVKRGIEHQSGIAKASESVGTHFGIDRKTSAQDLLAKPELLFGEARPSNLELFADAHKAQDRRKAAEILELLHPKDLIDSYQKLSNLQKQELIDVKGHETIREDEREIMLQRKAASEIRQILAENGATEDEQTVALMCLSGSAYLENLYHEKRRRFNEIKDSYKIRDLAHLVAGDKGIERLRYFFQKAGFEHIVYADEFIMLLANDLVDLSNTPGALGIPVNEESLLETLTIINSNRQEKDRFLENPNTDIVRQYIYRSNVKPERKNTDFSSDKVKIREFLEKLKQREVPVDVDTIAQNSGMKALKYHNEFFDHAGRTYRLDYDEKRAELIDEVFLSQLFEDEDIEIFFQSIKNKPNKIQQQELYGFLEKADSYFDENKTSDEQKLKVGAKIMSELKKNKQLTQEEFIRIGSLISVAFFRRDSNQFYAFLDEIMPSEAAHEYSPELAFSISEPILKGTTSDFMGFRRNNIINIQNFERLSEIPIIKLAIKHSLSGAVSAQSLGQLLESISETNKEYSGYFKISSSFFEDNLTDLILGREYRGKLLELVQKEVPDCDLVMLHKCLGLAYPDGPEKTHFLRTISNKITTSKDIPFESKLAYLAEMIDELGFDGLSLLAEQIEDINAYVKFRTRMEKCFEEYLSGKSATLKAAEIDLLSSFFAKDFKILFNTCRNDPDSQKKLSTDLAEAWIRSTNPLYFGSHKKDGELKDSRLELGMPHYDLKEDKFIIAGHAKQIFRTFSEIVDILNNLTPFERFATVHKALTEENGAFSNNKNRQILSRQIIDSLGIKDKFIKESFKFVCQKGDAKFLAFPVSKMLASLLFRSFDKEKVIKERILEIKIPTGEGIEYNGDEIIPNFPHYVKLKELPPENNILKALSKGRREVAVFGSRYKNYPETSFYKLSKESDEQFQALTQRLHEMLDESKENGEKNGAPEIDPSLNAIIKGVEGSGALGVRSLQLAVQMHEFSEPVRKRLSESFDSNPGLNKLLFWENLHKLSEEDPKIMDFVRRLRLKGYLGGGSLYTTFEALVDDNGKERRIALKMLNPNSEAFLKENHSIAQTVLEDVRKQGREMKKLADMGLVLTDLSHQWCLKDINDRTFIEDDNRFRKVVERFNARGGGMEYTIPERVFNTYNLKAEDLALGKTVNKVLNDQQVPNEIKQTLVKMMSEFFAFQLKGPKIQEEGENYALVHSDPHIGNYIVDIENPDMPIAVIDRHMYLKLESQDISVLEEFIAGNDLKFISALTERVLDINKVANKIERATTTVRVKSALMSNYFSQKVRGNVDKFSLLRTALSEFQKRGLDVPLNLRLMIRNIQALKSLTVKYGLNFEEIYNNFKL